MIRRNAHKYSISAQCKVLGISRGSYYYPAKGQQDEIHLADEVQTAYENNRKLYGSRKLKVVLAEKGIIMSRRKICRIMKGRGLASAYSRQKPYKSKGVNEAEIPNTLNREFGSQKPLAAVVSDLTYVRVGYVWHYVCFLVDLHNREVIGHSSGRHKDARLVFRAFASIKSSLEKIQLFHTDRGREFDNRLIDEVLSTFKIKRSLSMKGCPYDNAVAEATFKILKTEFVHRHTFASESQLALQLSDYVHWYNKHRIHQALGYLSPYAYKEKHAS